jgi:hypothetical protein
MDSTFVEVADEPKHHELFDTPDIRAMLIRIAPGAETLFHRHTEDTIYVILSECELRDTTYGASNISNSALQAGIAICRQHRHNELIHKIENHGGTEALMVGIELKSAVPLRTSVLDHPAFKVVFEAERCRGYRVKLAPGESIESVRRSPTITVAGTLCALEVAVNGSSFGYQTCVAGDIRWDPDPQNVRITNVGSTQAVLIIAEITIAAPAGVVRKALTP